MKLSDISIRRPVLASMMSLALVLFGVIGYLNLPVRDYPDVDPPIVSVSTVLPGANPQVVESAVTDILEEELSTVEGLRTLTSSSAEQVEQRSPWSSTSTGTSRWPPRTCGTRSPGCAAGCREDIEEPVVAKQEADAQPVLLAGALGRQLRPAPAVGYRRPAW